MCLDTVDSATPQPEAQGEGFKAYLEVEGQLYPLVYAMSGARLYKYEERKRMEPILPGVIHMDAENWAADKDWQLGAPLRALDFQRYRGGYHTFASVADAIHWCQQSGYCGSPFSKVTLPTGWGTTEVHRIVVVPVKWRGLRATGKQDGRPVTVAGEITIDPDKTKWVPVPYPEP